MHLRLKYLRELNLDGYEELRDEIIFRCPVCGDSDKSKIKKRGYILSIDDERCRYYCHNCGLNVHYIIFLKLVDYSVYTRYLEEKRRYSLENFSRYEEEPKTIEFTIKEKKEYNNLFSKYLYSIDEVKDDNDVKRYLLDKRKIPNNHFSNLYYFNGDIFSLYKKIFNDDKWDHKINDKRKNKGVVVPFVDKYNENVGFGFRMIDNKFMRFINLFKKDFNSQFFYGENKCDFQKDIYIVEGMIDKLSFRDDRQILCMISANSRLNYINELTDRKVTYIFDYEYMNNQILRRAEEIIDNNHNLFLWNSEIYKGKDINDLKTIYEKEDKDMLDFITKNSYNGYKAKIMLNKRYNELVESLLWRKNE